MKQGQTTSIIVIIAIIAFGIGYVFGGTPSDSNKKTFEDGWQAAKERIQETGFYYEDDKITKVRGTIKNVKDDRIIIKAEATSPLMDPNLDEREVIITDNTGIYKEVDKSEEQFNKEMQNFEEEISEWEKNQKNGESESTEPPEMPEPYIKEEINLSKVKADQRVRVLSAGEENIKNEKSFRASEIVLED